MEWKKSLTADKDVSHCVSRNFQHLTLLDPLAPGFGERGVVQVCVYVCVYIQYIRIIYAHTHTHYPFL